MRQLAAALLLVASAAPAFADCPPCERTTEISLNLVSKEFSSQTMSFSAVDSTYQKASPKGLEQDTLFVSSPAEMRSFILQQARACRRIKFLMVATHGGPGFITFDDGEDNASIIQLDERLPETLGGLSCAFAPGAEIRFAGCSVAKKCEGENFANTVAGLLLRQNGGTFRAETSTQRSVGGLTANFGLTKPHVLTVTAGGRPVWQTEPTSKSDCRENLTMAVSHLSACGTTMGREQPKTLGGVRDAIAAWDRMPSRFGNLGAMVKYGLAVEDYDRHKDCR